MAAKAMVVIYNQFHQLWARFRCSLTLVIFMAPNQEPSWAAWTIAGEIPQM
jgi:hypothetical protein